MIKDRIKFYNYVYQYQGSFFKFTVYASFKHTFSVALVLNFSFLEFFVLFGSFCFFCLPFCHPIGGRDSLKNERFTKKTRPRWNSELHFMTVLDKPHLKLLYLMRITQSSEHVDLPAKLPDFVLGSNNNNIYQFQQN